VALLASARLFEPKRSGQTGTKTEHPLVNLAEQEDLAHVLTESESPSDEQAQCFVKKEETLTS